MVAVFGVMTREITDDSNGSELGPNDCRVLFQADGRKLNADK